MPVTTAVDQAQQVLGDLRLLSSPLITAEAQLTPQVCPPSTHIKTSSVHELHWEYCRCMPLPGIEKVLELSVEVRHIAHARQQCKGVHLL